MPSESPTPPDKFFTYANEPDRLAAAFPDLFAYVPPHFGPVQRFKRWRRKLILLNDTVRLKKRMCADIEAWNRNYIEEYTLEHGYAPHVAGPSDFLTR